MVSITLYNGRGQLGSALHKEYQVKIADKNLKNIKIYELMLPDNVKASVGNLSRNVNIYHTWNFLDKSKETQLNCYNSFVKFVKKNKEEEIVFISTYSEQTNPYTYYKQLAEAYLLSNVTKSKIVKLPVIVGYGICKELQTGNKSPYGLLELISPEDAAKETLNIAYAPHTENRIFRVKGESISAKLATQLLTFK